MIMMTMVGGRQGGRNGHAAPLLSRSSTYQRSEAIEGSTAARGRTVQDQPAALEPVGPRNT
jgi:hypothetical protein